MLYIIKPAGHLTQDQRVQLRVDLSKQLTDGGSVIVLPFDCTIETLDTTPAAVMIAQHDAMLGGRQFPTPPTPPATRVLRNGYPAEWDVPLWKRAARALGFFRAEQLADLCARIRATEPPPAPPMKPKYEGTQPPGGLFIIYRRAGPPKEETNGEETRASISAYKAWLMTGIEEIGQFDRARCEHHYEVDRFSPIGQYICRYCRDIKIQEVQS